MLQGLYLLLCILGFVLPYSQFIPFVIEHGLDIRLFFEQLFANKISAFFGIDLIVSSFVLWIFVFTEGSHLKMRMLWIYIASNLVVGVSLALPLFLLMRQRQIEHQLVNTKTSSD
jgi:Terpene cyclase DEP1